MLRGQPRRQGSRKRLHASKFIGMEPRERRRASSALLAVAAAGVVATAGTLAVIAFASQDVSTLRRVAIPLLLVSLVAGFVALQGWRLERAAAIEAVGAAEDQAAEYLQSLGYTLVTRRYKARHGEIDIVALDGDVVVVCEVKTRTSARYGSPFEAITRDKASRLHRLGFAWLRAKGVRCAAVRVDVVAITRPGRGRTQLEHMQGVV